jgi:Flp pilus assembly protein TadD
MDPVDIKAHSFLGKAYQREGNNEMAEHHLGLVKTIENAKKCKDPIEVSIAMVRVLIDSGNLEQAYQQAEITSREYEEDWRSPYILGIALRAKGMIKEAIHQLHKAMSQNSLAPEPHLEMALVQSDVGEVLEAVGEARKAVNLSPRDPEIRRALAAILRSHGYTDQAIEEEELAEAFARKSD